LPIPSSPHSHAPASSSAAGADGYSQQTANAAAKPKSSAARGEVGAFDERDAARVGLEQRRALQLAAQVHARPRRPVIVREGERHLGRLAVDLVARGGCLERRFEPRLGRILQRDRLRFRGGALHARGHLAGDSALFLDRGCGGRDVFADALDRLLDAVERAHDIAEEGLDKLVEGDTKTGEKLIDKAKKIDPKAVDELAEEVERDKEKAERFVNRKPA